MSSESSNKDDPLQKMKSNQKKRVPSTKGRYIGGGANPVGGFRPGTSGLPNNNDEDLNAMPNNSGYNPTVSNSNVNANGGLIIRKRSGTSHA